MNLILIHWKNSPLNLGELTINSFDKLVLKSISGHKLEEDRFDPVGQLKGQPSSGESA
jgi:hypothetical protein